MKMSLNNSNKEKKDSKMKVLNLQEMDDVSGGAGAWSTASGGCGSVGDNEWSTKSMDCRENDNPP
jgi:hypothetical protein